MIARTLCASLARCAASVSPDAGDGGASTDARVTMDSGVRSDANEAMAVPDVVRRAVLAPFDCNSSSKTARNDLRSIPACFGRFVRLDDGEHCVSSEAPTGAMRYVLNCGWCESTYVTTR